MSINYSSSITTLFVLQVILFMLGITLALKHRGSNDRKLPLSIKVVISLSLTTAAFLAACYGSKDTFFYSIFVFFGMIFSFLGDLTMGSVIKLKNRLISAMIFFLLTHVFYIFGYTSTMLKHGVDIRAYVFFSFIISFIFFIICKIVFDRKHKSISKLRKVAMLYGAFTALMAAFAFSLALSVKGIWWITFAASLVFMMSDLMIAISDILKIRIKNVSIWVWASYIAAQMGIIYVVMI